MKPAALALCVMFSIGNACAAPPDDAAPAAAPVVSQPAPRPAFGSDTRAWLDLQSSNAQASVTSQTLPGPVMQKVYQRYVDSFARPIPDKFEQFSAKTDSK
jgi:hypothetical protein